MKNLLFICLTFSLLIGCKEESKTDDTPAINDEQVEEMAYLHYGAAINDSDAISPETLLNTYNNLAVGDKVAVKVKGTIQEVCANKGCWINLPLMDNQVAFVKFKDYEFFLPRNSAGKEVILSGQAYKEVTPVDELRHYAMDKGASEAEINAITEDKIEYKFMADGALVESFENPDVFEPAPAVEATESES